MRLIDADKLYPDCLTKKGTLAISQGQVANAPTVEQGEWIPISERLPDKNMACLVSVGDLHLTQIAMYSDLMGTISHKIFYQGDYGHENFSNITEYVKAWMPLPKSYKEADE